MPIYDYICESCDNHWEENLGMSSSEKPCKKPCPACKKKGKVKKHIGGFPNVSFDSTMTANKKTGGRWNEMMNKIKSGTPDRYHDNLNHDMTGKSWKNVK